MEAHYFEWIALTDPTAATQRAFSHFSPMLACFVFAKAAQFALHYSFHSLLQHAVMVSSMLVCFTLRSID
jgi:hypothetical protein